MPHDRFTPFQQRRRQAPRLGTQERGSAADPATAFNRNARIQSDLASGRNTPVTDPNQLDRFITPENTLRRQRLGFNVRNVNANTSQLKSIAEQLRGLGDQGGLGPSSFLQSLQQNVTEGLGGGMNREDLIRRQFESQLPFLDEQFQDQAGQIAGRTAALGRTGSGLVDRDFADLNLRAQRAREGLLGQLTSQAAQQAIQDRLGLLGAGGQLAGLETQREAAGRQQQLAALQAAGGLAGQASGLGLQAGGLNQQRDLARQSLLQQQQMREDALAQQAMNDRFRQLQLAGQGFGSNPAGILGQQAQIQLGASDQFGRGAAGGAAGLGSAAQGAAETGQSPTDLLGNIFGSPRSRPRRRGGTDLGQGVTI